ncbi:MAG: hypothetical protein GY739_09415 [Mesoflavibacter sp.]|nr:hypothetical protein [Mesoflavibacter sp.]
MKTEKLFDKLFHPKADGHISKPETIAFAESYHKQKVESINNRTMKLTGKAKIEFEKWLINSHDTSHNKNVLNGKIGQSFSECFYKLTESMQYGVYVDFFISEEIFITIHNEIDCVGITISGGHHRFDLKRYDEARTEAIKKANEIYNLS